MLLPSSDLRIGTGTSPIICGRALKADTNFSSSRKIKLELKAFLPISSYSRAFARKDLATVFGS